MKKVAVYQCSDGKTFADRAEAKAHQTVVNLGEAIASLQGTGADAKAIAESLSQVFIIKERPADKGATSKHSHAPSNSSPPDPKANGAEQPAAP